MVERICPRCQRGNALENRYCGACGSALERNEMVPAGQAHLSIAGQDLPLAQAKQIGQALALGLAALAAEASLAWLRRRVERIGSAPPQTFAITRQSEPRQTILPAQPELLNEVVTIVSQRVVEVWEHGNLTRQTVEKQVWRKTKQ